MIRPNISIRSIYRAVCFVSMLLLVSPLFAAHPAAAVPPPADLGDAPDSTNNFGVAMSAYPGVPANFPTVFNAGVVPPGPRHTAPKADAWLGNNASAEADADMLPDADGVRNIAPPANDPNNDRFDDGVFPVNPNNIRLPQCQQTSFNYIVSGATGVITHSAYINVWIDFNRDGDWADTLTCMSGGVAVNVREWAVQNRAVTVKPGVRTTYVTPSFRSFHPAGHAPVWMRITLAGQPAPLSPAGVADGRGPANGYSYGETEDYGLAPTQAPGGGTVYCNCGD